MRALCVNVCQCVPMSPGNARYAREIAARRRRYPRDGRKDAPHPLLGPALHPRCSEPQGEVDTSN